VAIISAKIGFTHLGKKRRRNSKKGGGKKKDGRGNQRRREMIANAEAFSLFADRHDL